MQTEDDILIIDGLTKKYAEKTAVNNLTLRIKRGTFFGLLGPNGAGKSSTIHCITGIAKITSGTITVDGVDVEKEYKEARKKVGLSPQEFNVDIFATSAELLEQFELVEHKDKKFKELSGGLKRRLILARALMHKPALLILDEPTAGVDVKQRYDLWEYLRKLNASGTTIILTSHYLEEIEALCSEIAIINNGVIVAEGTKDEFTKDGSSVEKKYLEITHGATY